MVHPVRFVRRDFLDPHARRALRAVQLAMTELLVRDVVSHLRRPTSHHPVIVSTAFVVPMDNARVTRAGPPHPTALNVQPVLPDSSSMGMATVLFADSAANNARMAAASVSPVSKALPRTLMTAQNVTQCNLRQALVPYVPTAASATDRHVSPVPLPARLVLVLRRITASCVVMVNSYLAEAVFQPMATAFVLAQA